MKTKEIWQKRLTRSRDISSSAKLVGLLIMGYTDDAGFGCWANQTTLALEASLGTTTVSSAVKELVASGFIDRKLARTCTEIPKRKGYILDLALPPSPSESDGEISSPSESEGEVPPSHKPKQNITLNHTPKSNPQNLVVSRSTTTDLLSEDAGSGGATSRAREATGDATQQTPDPVGRLQEEIVTALAGVDKYYPDPELQALGAVRQNRHHVRLILKSYKSLEEAIDYVQLRGVEWCERVRLGKDYTAPVILALIAADAERGWVRPKNPADKLKRQLAVQVKAQLDNSASWKIREGWLEEHYGYVDAPPSPSTPVELAPVEEVYEREPVVLGEVIGQMVPQAAPGSQVRRAPRGKPGWWTDLVCDGLAAAGQQAAGVDISDKIKPLMTLAQMVLCQAEVEVVDGVAWVSPGLILASILPDLTETAATWGAILTWHAVKQRWATRVEWTLKPSVELAARVEEVEQLDGGEVRP